MKKAKVIGIIVLILIVIGAYNSLFGKKDDNKQSDSNQFMTSSEKNKNNSNDTLAKSSSSTKATTQPTVKPTDKPTANPTNDPADEIIILKNFYDDFEVNGTADNLESMISQYGLYADYYSTGTGYDYYKVANSYSLSKVIGLSDFNSDGNFVVIKVFRIGDDKIEEIEFHKDINGVKSVDKGTPKNGKAKILLSEDNKVEINALQALFVSLNKDMTKTDIDAYIEKHGLVKYSFSFNSGYYIGFNESAIRQRDVDREGEAVDISFNKDGTVKSAVYAIHTGFDTNYLLNYSDGVFYYDEAECESGEAAMQWFLKH